METKTAKTNSPADKVIENKELKQQQEAYIKAKQNFTNDWCNKMSDAAKAGLIFNLIQNQQNIIHTLQQASRPQQQSRIIKPH